ncbi:MAG: TIGR00730 family Rossman fold protein [Parvibaculaceae bacterium]|nr:TIGR00730 family Rossman fold protein [Parvibaculaceae bacterium]
MTENICVYCGSSTGDRPSYLAAGTELGEAIGEAGMGLVYGGATIGIMGAVARAVTSGNGPVIGVIPEFLFKEEIPYTDASELIVTENMHERKQIMYDRSCAFVALPGGIGTLEELMEILTWAQLGQHQHPVIIANIDGFWDALLALFDNMLASGFVRPSLLELFHVVNDASEIIPLVRRLSATSAG